MKAVIEQARPLIFNFDYPIFDESYRKVLETKILRHYYLREICTTPWARWQLMLEDKMNMIMPYFNQLYESEKLAFNPLVTVDYGRKSVRNEGEKQDRQRTQNDERNVDETGSITQTVDSSNTVSVVGNTNTKHSDTPQNNLYGVLEDKYLSDFTTNDTNTNTSDSGSSTSESNTKSNTADTNKLTENSTANINSTEDYIESITGKNSGDSYSKLLMEFRETFLNIDKVIIEELNPLFFGLYGGDY